MKTKNNYLMLTMAVLLSLMNLSAKAWAEETASPKQTPSSLQPTYGKESNKTQKKTPTVDTNPALYGEAGQEDNTSDMTPYENESGEE